MSLQSISTPRSFQATSRPKKRRWVRFVVGVLAVFFAIGGLVLWKAGSIVGRIAPKGGIFSSLVNSLPGVDKKLAGESDGRVNIVLLGMRGKGVEGGGTLADTIMVHPSLERYATMIATSELIPQTFAATGLPTAGSIITAAASSNPFKGRVKVIVNPFLSNVAGYVYCSKRPIKPFIWQLREAPVFQALVDPTLPNMFERREFVYGAEAQGGAGYSLPFLCIRLSNGLSSAAALTTGQTSTVGGS